MKQILLEKRKLKNSFIKYLENYDRDWYNGDIILDRLQIFIDYWKTIEKHVEEEKINKYKETGDNKCY